MKESRIEHPLQKAFDESLGHNASRLGFLMRQETQKCIKASGYKITPEQWQALVYLEGAGEKGMTQTELGELILKDKTTITRLLKGMFDNQLIVISRGQSEDRRTNLIRVTESSKTMVAAIWPYIISHYSEKVFVNLDQTERAEFLRLMQKVRKGLGDM